MRTAHLICGLLLLGLTAPCLSAQEVPEAQIDVQAGWGGHLRLQRWAPIYVTASSRRTRNVVLSVEWPGGGDFLMHTVQYSALDRNPRTFPLLLPVRGWQLEQASFRLLDADSGKTLAVFPSDATNSAYYGPFGQPIQGPLIGFSGARGGQLNFSDFGWDVTTGFLEPRLLPENAVGYDALNVLILNEPNLVRNNFGPTALTEAQQQAIVDWVRAGGNLILWPGDAGFPEHGPLVDILPARVGNRVNIQLSAKIIDTWKLDSSRKKLAPYRLQPKGTVDNIPLFDEPLATGFSGRVGLGRIAVFPIDLEEIRWIDSQPKKKLWKSILVEMFAFPPDQPDATPNSGGNNYQPVQTFSSIAQQDDTRQSNTSMRVADFLGTVKGAESIGFSYVAIVLIGLMLVVGPVDWIVLKKLGRQPWTWATTTGWIALITLSAIFAGHIFKSGDLTYRTLQTINQVEDSTVATTNYVALYSPRTKPYSINASDGWWQSAGVNDNSAGGYKINLEFHQTEDGNLPEPMMVNVWSLRFLRGDTVALGPPLIKADLHFSGADAGITCLGTIQNLSDSPLKNLHFATGKWTGELSILPANTSNNAVSEIPPGATANVQSTQNTRSPTLPSDDNASSQNGYAYYYGNGGKPITAEDLWKSVWNLEVGRERRAQSLVESEPFICIYAESANPPPAAALSGPKDHEQHRRFIRAIVRLK